MGKALYRLSGKNGARAAAINEQREFVTTALNNPPSRKRFRNTRYPRVLFLFN